MWGGHRWLASALAVPSIAAVVAQLFFSVQRTDRSQLARFFSNLYVGGHRGCSADAPENTIAAFELAKEHGADAVEFDLEFTKDDVPIVLHDAEVDRTTNGTGSIADLTWAQVNKLNAAAKFKDGTVFPHTPIPTLDQTVEFCIDKKLKLFFDVKAPDQRAVDVLTKLYKKHPWLYDNAAVCSFYPWLVYQVKRVDRNIITAHTWRRWSLSYSNTEQTIPRHSGFKHYLALIGDIFNVWSIHSWMPYFTGADMVLANRLDISAGYVEGMRSKGMHVVVWTVNDPKEQLWMRHSLNIVYLTDQTSTTPLIKQAAQLMQESDSWKIGNTVVHDK